MSDSDTKFTNQLLMRKNAKLVEGVDKYYRYHQAHGEFVEVVPYELVDTGGFRFIVHKTREDLEYYMASEIATGICSEGSHIDPQALIERLKLNIPPTSNMLHDVLQTKPLSPRYTYEVSELSKSIAKAIK